MLQEGRIQKRQALWSTTWKWTARHSCILRVEAVMIPPGTFWTLLQRQLVACAPHLVQPNTVGALAKMCLLPRSCHTAVKAEGKNTVSIYFFFELNINNVAQAGSCRPTATAAWLSHSIVLRAFFSDTCICARTMKFIHFLKTRCSLRLASLCAPGVARMLVILLGVEVDKPTHALICSSRFDGRMWLSQSHKSLIICNCAKSFFWFALRFWKFS